MATSKKKPNKMSTKVTDEEIAGLAKEAASAGDDQMVKIAGRALSGSAAARKECARVIMAARSMRDDY